jgi:hypothetical protein
MSEVFALMHQAGQVAETAKDAMGSSLVADKTTAALAQIILTEAKRLLPNNRIVQSLILPTADADWTSVRSAMQAVHEGLSTEHSAELREANRRASVRRGPWS